jgi:hypothetical protein
MSQAVAPMEAAATAAEKLKRICVHVSPRHLADAKRLSQVLCSPDGKKLTAAAVLRMAQDIGLELLLQEQGKGH